MSWPRRVTSQFTRFCFPAWGPNGGGKGDRSGGVGKAIPIAAAGPNPADLNAVVDTFRSCLLHGKVVVMAFCWGGGQTFPFCDHNKDVKRRCPFMQYPTDEAALRASIARFTDFTQKTTRASPPRCRRVLKR